MEYSSPKLRDKIILHLGYPKTGTTFLQQNVYPKLNNIRYLGKFYRKKEIDDENTINIERIRDYLCNSKFNDLNIEKEIISEFKNITNKNTTYLLSAEYFFDIEVNEIRNNQVEIVMLHTVCNRAFEFFHKFFESVEIMITIRNPDTLLHRMYLDRYAYYRHFNIMSYEEFLKYQFQKNDSFGNSLIYEKLINNIEQEYRNKVFFFKYEKLFDKDHLEISKLSKLIEITENKLKDLFSNEIINKSKIKNNSFQSREKVYPLFLYRIYVKISYLAPRFITTIIKYLFDNFKQYHKISNVIISPEYRKTREDYEKI